MKKYKIIGLILIVLFLLQFNFLFSQEFQGNRKGFNIIQGNELNLTEYTFDDFMDEFRVDGTFVCIKPSSQFGANYFDRFVITEMKSQLGKKCKLEKYLRANKFGAETDPMNVIGLNKENFEEFRKCFIEDHCLRFSSGFPVKFMKVKTINKAGDIDFHYIPGDEMVIEDAPKDNIIYYAYKKTTVGNNKYVYLGTKKYFTPERLTDVKKTLIGWVLYDENGNNKNVVLWNTDIGLRPRKLTSSINIDKKPIVFLKDREKSVKLYYEKGKKPDNQDLLVNSSGLNEYHKKFEHNLEQSFRWLPMYSEQMSYTHDLDVGVIDSLYLVRKEIIDKSRLRQLKIAFLIDASKSMEKIWNNLDQVLLNVLTEVVNKDFKNIAGKQIDLKIRIYYFTDNLYTLNNEEYISTPEGVNRYKKKIEAISQNLQYTEYLLPSLYKFYNEIYNDMAKAQPEEFISIIIGDAGDKTYNKEFSNIESIISKAKQELSPIFGIAFNSDFYNNSSYWKNKDNITINDNISEKVYEDSYNRFKNNFEIIAEIDKHELNQNDVKKISNSISNKVVSEIEGVIGQLSKFVKGTESRENSFQIEPDSLSIFSRVWLDELKSKISRPDSGTYFEQGIVLDKDVSGHPLLVEDVIIEKDNADDLQRHISEFIKTSDDAHFKRLLRWMLAIFFEINYGEVDQKLLRETTLADFWEAVVGDRQIAQKITPDLFEYDTITFDQIGNNWIKYKTEIVNNASDVKWYINAQLQNEIGLFQTLVEYASEEGIKKYIDYYWLDVNEIRLFKNVPFKAVQE